MKSTRKDHLVKVARDLFYQHGFHAVGIDRILAEANVSKTTLYKHFKSKDFLVVAALDSWAEYLSERLDRVINERGKLPLSRVEALFILLGRMSTEKNFNGDMFLNAMAEYNEKNHVVRQKAQEYKEKSWAWISEVVEECNVMDPVSVARQIVILYEGSISALQISRETAVADFSRRQVRSLISASKRRVG